MISRLLLKTAITIVIMILKQSICGKGVTLKDSLDNIFGYIYIVFDDTENHIKREQIENSLARLKVSVDTGDSILWEYDVENDKLTVDFGSMKTLIIMRG